MGFGTETDLRDRNGEVVVAHDLPTNSDMLFEDFCRIYKSNPGELLLALNIKSDGLGGKIEEALRKHQITNYFLFDMSIPQLRMMIKFGLQCFTRISEIEPQPYCYENTLGIWLDSFESDWYGPSDIYQILKDGKRVCLVSPELHQRDEIPTWKMLKEAGLHLEDNLILCTDFPEFAYKFFIGENL